MKDPYPYLPLQVIRKLYNPKIHKLPITFDENPIV